MIVNKSIGDSEERVNGRLEIMEKDIKEVKEMGNKIYKNMKSAVDDQIVELQI